MYHFPGDEILNRLSKSEPMAKCPPCPSQNNSVQNLLLVSGIYQPITGNTQADHHHTKTNEELIEYPGTLLLSKLVLDEITFNDNHDSPDIFFG